jgi:trigger factor
MNHSIENLSATRAKVTVTISGEETAAEARVALREVSAHAQVPGFRAGKAPEAVIRQRFGKHIADALDEGVRRKAFEHARDNAGLKIFNVVGADNAPIKAGEEVSLTFTFDLEPQFEVPTYTGIKTTVRPVVVEEAEIDAEIENLRRSRATYNVVEREAQAGDYVKLSYDGTVDATPIAELTDKRIWGKQDNTWEEAGQAGPNTLGVPCIVEGIIGMKAGDQKDLEQQFEENHEAEALRGKKGIYHVSVHEVRERVLPELNAELFESLKIENLEQLRARIRKELEDHKNYQRHMSQREQITRSLMEACVFELPQTAIEFEANSVMQHFMRDNMRRGVKREEFEKNKEALHEGAMKAGELQARRNMILGAIAKAEKVEVTADDINQAVYSQALRMRVRPEEIVRDLTKNREALREMQRSILLDKTMELLVTKAEVVEDATATVETEHDHQ